MSYCCLIDIILCCCDFSFQKSVEERVAYTHVTQNEDIKSKKKKTIVITSEPVSAFSSLGGRYSLTEVPGNIVQISTSYTIRPGG